jgi:tetratricopeptide (TPR) repeat protein
MSLWSIHGSSQCLMLGTPERLNIDYVEFSKRLRPALESSKLVEYGVDSTPKFLSFLLLGEDEIAELLEDVERISTDDLPYAQFQFGRVLVGVQECIDLLKYQDTILPYLRNLGENAEAVRAELNIHRDISQRLNLGFFLGQWNEFQKAAHLARRHGFPHDANVTTALRYDSERLRHHLGRVAKHPHDPEVHNSLGYIYWRRGDYQRAIRHLSQAVSLGPSFGNAFANLAQVQMALGNLDDATQSLLRATAADPGSTMLSFARGAEHVIHLMKRIESEGPSVEGYLALASAYMDIGDLLNAVDAARNAERLIVNDATAYLELARFYTGLELIDEVAEAYRMAAKLTPGDARVTDAAEFARSLQMDARKRQSWLHRRHSVWPTGRP